MSQCNGWTNYATWRVNLEIFDGMNPTDMSWHKLDVFDLSDILKENCEEILSMDTKPGLALDYALAFVADVNWREIAESMIDAYADEKEEA